MVEVPQRVGGNAREFLGAWRVVNLCIFVHLSPFMKFLCCMLHAVHSCCRMFVFSFITHLSHYTMQDVAQVHNSDGAM